MATHSSTLAWRIPWMQELVGYSPWGRKESDMAEQILLSLIYQALLCVLYILPYVTLPAVP